MRKTFGFKPVLVVFVLLGVFVTLPGGKPARVVRADEADVPAGIHAPILSPFITIWMDAVDNHEPSVAYNPRHDEYLVVWYNVQGPTMWDIYAQRVRGNGTLATWFTVATDVGRKNWQPVVAYSPVQDEYLVVYTYDASASDYDIYARRISWNGGQMSAEFSINIDSGKQWNPAVAYNVQNDEYLVVYENWWASGLRDIAAQRVRASDGQLLSWRNIATGAGQERIFPDVAYNEGRNEYLIVYTFGVGSNGNIYGKITSANMGALSSEIHICDDGYDQDFPSVAAARDEYLVVWEDGTFGTDDYDIYGRRVDGNGVPQNPGGGFSIAEETPNLHVNPYVAFQPGYGYLVTWRYYNSGASGQDIYGRYVMPGDNHPSGTAFGVDTGTALQAYPALTCDFAGKCLVVEEDNVPGPDYEIRGRFVLTHMCYVPVIFRNH